MSRKGSLIQGSSSSKKLVPSDTRKKLFEGIKASDSSTISRVLARNQSSKDGSTFAPDVDKELSSASAKKLNRQLSKRLDKIGDEDIYADYSHLQPVRTARLQRSTSEPTSPPSPRKSQIGLSSPLQPKPVLGAAHRPSIHKPQDPQEAQSENPAGKSQPLDEAVVRQIREQLSTGTVNISHKGWDELPPILCSGLSGSGGLRMSCLELEGHQLRAVSPGLSLPHLTNLVRLNLASNLIITLPPQINALICLKFLNLENNALKSLPEELCECGELRRLYLGNNALTSLPADIANLSSLTHLHLHKNQLCHIPLGVCALFDLVELTYGHNRLTAVPVEMAQLQKLHSLTLKYNRLSALHGSLGSLHRSLTELHLNNNEIQLLPREMSHLTALKKLTTGCNPMLVPPPEVCMKGTKAVLDYLRDWDEGGVEEAMKAGVVRSAAEAENFGSPGVGSPEKEQLCERCLALGEDLRQIKEELGHVKSKRDAAEADATRARDQMMRKDKQLMEHEKTLREQQATVSEAEKRFQQRSFQVAQGVQNSQKQVAGLSTEVKRLSAQVAELSRQLEDQTWQLAEEQRSAADRERQLDEQKCQVAEQSERAENAEVEMEALRRQLQQEKMAREAAEEKLQQMEKTVTDSQSSQHSVQNILQNQMAELRVELAAQVHSHEQDTLMHEMETSAWKVTEMDLRRQLSEAKLFHPALDANMSRPSNSSEAHMDTSLEYFCSCGKQIVIDELRNTKASDFNSDVPSIPMFTESADSSSTGKVTGIDKFVHDQQSNRQFGDSGYAAGWQTRKHDTIDSQMIR